MLAGILLAIALVALCSTVYSVLLASIKWAQDIGRSIQEDRDRRQKFKARCATCGTNFLENTEVEDGICVDCQRPVCSRCMAHVWRCPYCNKRLENEYKKETFGRRKDSISSVFQNILNVKDDNSCSDSMKWSLDGSLFNGTSGYSTSSVRSKSKLPDFDASISLGWSSDYESDTGKSTAIENWEDNWLFKKKFPTIEYMQPLSMFVPKPNKVSNARIGGIDVDDLSDLSDYSDSEFDDIIR